MEIFSYFILLIVSIGFLVRSGMYIVHSISAISRFFGLSDFILSFIFLSLATSLPELSVGISSALSGIPELSFGDILGTNMVNLTLIVGLTAVLGGGLKMKDYESFEKEKWLVLLLVLSPIILIIDGELSRLDGVILIFLFLFNLINLIKGEKNGEKKKIERLSYEKHTKASAKSRKEFIKKIGVFILGIVVLILSAYGVVYAIREISLSLGVPRFILGIILIGIGTSLPELSIGIRSAREKKGGIPLGNIFGAISINSTLVLGLVSVIHPIVLPEMKSVLLAGGFTAISIILIYFFMRGKDVISGREGGVLLVIYAIFIITQIIPEISIF